MQAAGNGYALAIFHRNDVVESLNVLCAFKAQTHILMYRHVCICGFHNIVNLYKVFRFD